MCDNCGYEHKLEGKQIDITGFDGYFTLTYAGWGEEWIVKDEDGTDMLRCHVDETWDHLIEPTRACQNCGKDTELTPEEKILSAIFGKNEILCTSCAEMKDAIDNPTITVNGVPLEDYVGDYPS